jgi:hypothetical protein
MKVPKERQRPRRLLRHKNKRIMTSKERKSRDVREDETEVSGNQEDYEIRRTMLRQKALQ